MSNVTQDINLATKSLALLTGFMMLTACEPQTSNEYLTYTITDDNKIIDIPATGELEATRSTSITVPAGIFEPQQISWMIDENSMVKKGQVVARLNDNKYRFQSEQEKNKKQQISLDETVKTKQLAVEKSDISSDQMLIKDELTIADEYTIEDFRLFSKNEVIDKLNNKEYLQAKLEHSDWQLDSYQTKSSTEMQLLQLQQNEVSTKLSMYLSSLKKMAIEAPHDGIFVLARNWRGEKKKVGEMVFPGSKFATIPDLSEMQAKLLVLESESANLTVGSQVNLQLDAYPNKPFQGKISRLDPVAKTKQKGNPVKYLQVTVALDETDSDFMRPGDQLSARIILTHTEQGVLVPTSALIKQGDDLFVPILEQGSRKEKPVEIGIRSGDFTQVISGLESGEQVILYSKESVL